MSDDVMNYTIKQVFDRWNERFPDQKISRQTVHNWAKRFNWGVNNNRVIMKQKLYLDAAKVDAFFADPRKFLGSDNG